MLRNQLLCRATSLEYPDAWYHVMNRGIEGNNIFNDSPHFQLFCCLLGEVDSNLGRKMAAFLCRLLY